ncbi:type II toxin-antitoxin system VapB family antitoxin [Rhodoferax sp. OV413]|uniref:type II toxin-antitoxin system VapB family antitoxin n=1 Tax=Rhodoferax sp. OV413 TaxID=1855285 RepID=UPI0025D0F1C4|nr:type II toxin-antitoxin system VapB family antitoxin [Rhodoferax sp. OV413]
MSTSTVFTTNRSQAIRLPADMRLPAFVKRVNVRARGLERIITPVENTWDSFFQETEPVPEDFMPERASQEQAPRESL